jgi:hypothetical protein
MNDITVERKLSSNAWIALNPSPRIDPVKEESL